MKSLNGCAKICFQTEDGSLTEKCKSCIFKADIPKDASDACKKEMIAYKNDPSDLSLLHLIEALSQQKGVYAGNLRNAIHNALTPKEDYSAPEEKTSNTMTIVGYSIGGFLLLCGS